MLCKRILLGGAMMLMTSCATTPHQTVAKIDLPPCPKLEANAEFSCWWSDKTSPLSHCVLVRDNNPSCGIPERAIAYFNQGAIINSSIGDERPGGAWMVIKIFEDENGRVGQRFMVADNTYIDVDRQAAARGMLSAPKDPVWPRWPAGYEGGPEQVKR
jgi:hypothetical protein